MIAGEKDPLCPPERAYDQSGRIQTMANFIKIEGLSHGVASKGETFFNLMKAELTDEKPDSMTTTIVSPLKDQRASYEVLGKATSRLDDCGEGCLECRYGWQGQDPS